MCIVEVEVEAYETYKAAAITAKPAISSGRAVPSSRSSCRVRVSAFDSHHTRYLLVLCTLLNVHIYTVLYRYILVQPFSLGGVKLPNFHKTSPYVLQKLWSRLDNLAGTYFVQPLLNSIH